MKYSKASIFLSKSGNAIILHRHKSMTQDTILRTLELLVKRFYIYENIAEVSIFKHYHLFEKK